MPVRHSLGRIIASWCVLSLVLGGVLERMPRHAGAAGAGPGDRDRRLYAAVLPAFENEIYDQTAGHLSRYRISANFTPAAGEDRAQVSGTIALDFVNETGEPVKSLPFRLYPNLNEYAEGQMTIESVTSADQQLVIETGNDESLATVELLEPVPAGDAIDLTLSFSTTIPTDLLGSFGMFGFNTGTGTYALAHWAPILTGWDPASGWQLGPPSLFGDPVFSNTSLYDVTLSAPPEFTVLSTGVETTTEIVGASTAHHFVSGPARDFTLVLDADFATSRTTVGDTVVTSYFDPRSEPDGDSVLRSGANSISVFNSLFGTYPFKELDLVEVDLGNGAGGVEFPQMVFIGADYYADDNPAKAIPDFLEFIVAHEVAHQWWYSLVGNNQYLHAFLDESLTNYSATLYFEELYGEDAFQEQIAFNLKSRYFAMLFDGGDQVVDQPTDDFPSQRTYNATIYGKGALGFDAVRTTVGDDAFYAALSAYAEDLRFGVAEPGELEAQFEEASGQDLRALWHHWFETPNGLDDYNQADLDKVRQEIGR